MPSTDSTNCKVLILVCIFIVILLLYRNNQDKFEDGADAVVFEADPQSWQSVMSDADIVFCKFYAPWCPHCTKLDEPMNKLAKEYIHNKRVKIVKLDADKYKEFGQQHQVEGFPTIKLYKNGVPVDKYQGPRTVEGFKQYINSHL